MKYKTLEEFEAAVEAITEGSHRYPDRWVTSGMTGGSCYGDEPYPVSPEPEPDDPYLDKILEDAFPSMSFLEYKRMLRAEVYTRGSYSDQEYYGNYYRGETRQLNVEELFKSLVDIASCR